MIIAGFGGVARGFLSVAKELCSTYRDIVILDVMPQPDWKNFCPHGQFLEFDIRKSEALGMLLSTVPGCVFVNLCAGVDNVEVRKVVARAGGMYIDTAGSAIGETYEGRDSVLLPHTFKPVDVPVPQVVCAGINPGMVELLARRVLQLHFPHAKKFDFESFEYDTLMASCDGVQPVSWCVQSLVDEIVASPSAYRMEGRYIEEPESPAMRRTMLFDGKPVLSHIVCHEEIWTLGKIAEASVNRAFFSYAFREPVMQALLGTDRKEVAGRLSVPHPHKIVSGDDSVVVKLCTEYGDRAFKWELSHVAVAADWGVNATQYQTAACLAVFLEWMISGHVPSRAVPYCAADMPVKHWRFLEELMSKYGVIWREVDASAFALTI